MAMIVRRGVLTGAVALAAMASAARAQPSPGSTLDKVRASKVLRVSAIVGAEPYFKKSIADGTWSGAGVEMANSIAVPLGAKVVFVEATYANSIVDLNSDKSDIAFGLNPTAERALAIAFSKPYYMHPFSFLATPGFAAKSWADINKPEVRVCASIGTLPDVLVRRYAPKATVVMTKTIDQAVLEVQSGHASAIVSGVLPALGIKAKNRQFSTIVVPNDPRIALPTCLGVRPEIDPRWVNYLNAWIDLNRSSGQVMEWIAVELAKGGIARDEIPADA